MSYEVAGYEKAVNDLIEFCANNDFFTSEKRSEVAKFVVLLLHGNKKVIAIAKDGISDGISDYYRHIADRVEGQGNVLSNICTYLQDEGNFALDDETHDSRVTLAAKHIAKALYNADKLSKYNTQEEQMEFMRLCVQRWLKSKTSLSGTPYVSNGEAETFVLSFMNSKKKAIKSMLEKQNRDDYAEYRFNQVLCAVNDAIDTFQEIVLKKQENLLYPDTKLDTWKNWAVAHLTTHYWPIRPAKKLKT